MSEKKLEVYQSKNTKDNNKINFLTVVILFFVLLYVLIYQLLSMLLTPIGILTIVIFTLLWKYVL